MEHGHADNIARGTVAGDANTDRVCSLMGHHGTSNNVVGKVGVVCCLSLFVVSSNLTGPPAMPPAPPRFSEHLLFVTTDCFLLSGLFFVVKFVFCCQDFV